ncbi:hypothetical protein HHL16_12500 [Pseudoflavitalea sp. G-6-1-2]|uniref:dihydrofolate reductase family protein n=1 Tax=Pseudoflavitalea sp. G-6-1-2 TaxID=2728841 RepID=UPI00146B37F5|nr:dihydrofolate reductase [Pseudoflavitalea sp. G-6-1-2]NML21703.1 hypothetical protein [Pseudoflavitalea sp. G-6-1-2]
MKVTLIANISANGKILLSENTRYQAPDIAMGLFMETATRAGNLVIGKKTFEMLQRVLPDVKGFFPGVELVLISSSGISNEFKVVGSAEEAISYLTEKGYTEIAVGGGTITYNAFLSKDRITDVCVNIHPVIIGDGGIWGTDHDLSMQFKLISQQSIGENIVQLHLSRS